MKQDTAYPILLTAKIVIILLNPVFSVTRDMLGTMVAAYSALLIALVVCMIQLLRSWIV